MLFSMFFFKRIRSRILIRFMFFKPNLEHRTNNQVPSLKIIINYHMYKHKPQISINTSYLILACLFLCFKNILKKN